MWANNMYRLRVGQRLRELAVLTAVGAALNLVGTRQPLPAEQAVTEPPSSVEGVMTPSQVGVSEITLPGKPAGIRAWPGKHPLTPEEHEALLQRIHDGLPGHEPHALGVCTVSGRETSDEGTGAAVATADGSGAAAASRTPCVRHVMRVVRTSSDGVRVRVVYPVSE